MRICGYRPEQRTEITESDEGEKKAVSATVFKDVIWLVVPEDGGTNLLDCFLLK